MKPSFILVLVVLPTFVTACPEPRTLVETCLTPSECSSGICLEGACLQRDLDADGDGLTNAEELELGTDILVPDSDGDGTGDGVEIGNPSAPGDTDGDGVIDALESSVEDSDGDCIADQLDGDDSGADGIQLHCMPAIEFGVCATARSNGDLTLSCPDRADGQTVPDCVFAPQVGYEPLGETACDGIDSDCDGTVDDVAVDGVASECCSDDTACDGLTEAAVCVDPASCQASRVVGRCVTGGYCAGVEEGAQPSVCDALVCSPASCDGGQFRPAGVCGAGACNGGVPMTCDDGNPCTDDGCDTATGCTTTNDDTNTCDDGDACTGLDACVAGVCAGTVEVTLQCVPGAVESFDACGQSNGVVESCDLGCIDGACIAPLDVVVGSGQDPDVAHLSDGSFVVVYGDSASTVRARQWALGSDSTWQASGPEMVLSDLEQGLNASVVAVDDGFVATWSNGQYPNEDVFFRHVTGAGVMSAETQVDIDQPTNQAARTPSIAYNGSRAFFAWESASSDGGGYGIWGGSVSYSGGTWTADQSQTLAINELTAADQDEAAVAVLADGRFVVVWNSGAGGSSLKAQIFDATGVPEGNEFEVSSLPPASLRVGHSVAGLANGGFVVVSSYTGAASGDQDWIVANVWSSDLMLLTVDDVADTGSNFYPDVAATPEGGFVVTWMRTGPNRAYAREYDSSWNPKEVPCVVGSETLEGGRPNVAAGAGGIGDRIAVVWSTALDECILPPCEYETRAQFFEGPIDVVFDSDAGLWRCR